MVVCVVVRLNVVLLVPLVTYHGDLVALIRLEVSHLVLCGHLLVRKQLHKLRLDIGVGLLADELTQDNLLHALDLSDV